MSELPEVAVMVADLKPGDVVDMPRGLCEVERLEWQEYPIDSTGAQAVRVHWTNYTRSTLLAADRELNVVARQCPECGETDGHTLSCPHTSVDAFRREVFGRASESEQGTGGEIR